LESLKVEQSASIIITMNTLLTKKLIYQAVLDYYPQAKLIVKVNSRAEQSALSGLNIQSFVHARHEAALLLVKRAWDQQ
jgi:CPA2 family monovalent cation:H+ antiporter-2